MFFYEQPQIRDQFRKAMRMVHDLERLLGRVIFGNANARDLTMLRVTLESIPQLNQFLSEVGEDSVIRRGLREKDEADDQSETVSPAGELLDPVMEIRELLASALQENPPLTVREGGMIRDGYDEELDELRAIRKDGRGYIARLQEQERKKTDIPSLKVSYNKIFGYYIEITNIHKDKAPDHYIRKQTLTNSERFITPELKEFEAKVLHAEDRIKEVEYTLLQQVLESVRGYGPRLKTPGSIVGAVGCLSKHGGSGFAISILPPGDYG